MGTINRPQKDSKVNLLSNKFNRNDSVGVVVDLINFEKSVAKLNGVPENLKLVVPTAYIELKNYPSKVNDYSKLNRASKTS